MVISNTWPETLSWAVGLPVMLFINCYFGVKVYQTFTKKPRSTRRGVTAKAKKNAMKLNAVGILVSTVCSTLCVISALLISFVHRLPCVPFVRVGGVFYQLSKLIMYTIFVLRVDKVYNGTAYAYSKQMLQCLLGFCWLMGAVLLVVVSVTAKSVSESKDKYVRDCDAAYLPWHLALAVFLDIVMCVSCLWMFTRPLQKMIEAQRVELQKSGTEAGTRRLRAESRKLHSLALRYTVVTWTAVCTTFVLMVSIATLKTVVLGPLDMAVNAICLGLMTNWYHQHFERLCLVSLWCAHWCCCCRCDVPAARQRLASRGLPELVAMDSGLSAEVTAE